MRSLSGLIGLAALTAAVFVCTATGSTAKASLLKACGYMTTDGGASVENIKVVDRDAAGARGTFVFSAPGVVETKQLKLGSGGTALLSFPVTSPETTMIAIHLPTAPATSETFHFTLRPLPSDQAASNGCKPR